MKVRTSNREYWRRHVEKEKTNGLSTLEYCRREELKSSTFRYWKKKFSTSPPHIPPKSPFLKVSIPNKKEVEHPDPKWVAQFISFLMKEGI